MTQQNLHDKIKALLTERGNEYGQTWLTVGELMRNHMVGSTPLFTQTAYGHNWVQIVGKMFRALYSPHKLDHYYDAIGYLKLIIADIEAKGGNNDATE